MCGVEGLPCARCRLHYYCGKDHQRKHWPEHSVGCGSIEMREGRMVASRDIPAETVVLRETPRVTFADVHGHGFLRERMCFGCYGVLPKGTHCRRCGVPVCGEACSKDDRHAAECEAFQRAKFKVSERDTDEDDYLFLVVAVRALRTALIARRDIRIKNLSSTLDLDHPEWKMFSDTREESVKCMKLMRAAVQWLRTTVGVSWMSEEELLHAGLVNHLNGESVFDRNMKSCWGMFVGSTLLGFSCLPNTADLPLDDRPGVREHVTVTTRHIAAGEHLTRMPGSWWDSTRVRQRYVLAKRSSLCRCPRCKDPTEKGMYVSSPCCPSCAKNGKLSYIVAASEDRQEWKCESCGRAMSVVEVDALTEGPAGELERLKSSCASGRSFSDFVRQQTYPRGPLHDTHTLVFSALETSRCNVYTQAQTSPLKEDDVSFCIDACRRLVRGLDRLLPGVNEHRLIVFMALRRLLLYRHGSPQDSMTQYFLARGMEVYGAKPRFEGDLAALKSEIEDVTREVVRHIFSRDDAEPKFTLMNFPFVEM